MNRIAFPIIALSALATTAQAAEVQIASTGPVVELTIMEQIEAEPDLVRIGAGVTSEAPTAVEALRQNSAEMRRVIDRLLELGVPETDIQTSGINLSARYDYDQINRKQVFRGYQVLNRVSVKLREIGETGEVLDALVAAGATDLSGPNFSIEDDTDAKVAARRSAMARARAQATEYAEMAGYSGLRLLEVSEAISATALPQERRGQMETAEVVAASAPVQPGMVTTGVRITVKYEMTQ